VEIQIHLLDRLSKNSYSEIYNFRPKAGIAAVPQVIDFYCQGLINVYKFSLENFHHNTFQLLLNGVGCEQTLYIKNNRIWTLFRGNIPV
jgi:hypothetical protein